MAAARRSAARSAAEKKKPKRQAARPAAKAPAKATTKKKPARPPGDERAWAGDDDDADLDGRAPAASPVTTVGPAPAPPPSKTKRVKVPFPKKNQAPSEAEFVARLPLAIGKRFEAVRGFLGKQKRVTEELYYYGPKTGWAYRYLRDGHSVGTIMIHDERLLGIVSLDPAALAGVDWAALSPAGQRARQMAHGSPVLLWVDLPLEGSGAADFKALLKAKLRSLPATPPPPPPPPPARAAPSAGRRLPPPPPPPPPRRPANDEPADEDI